MASSSSIALAEGFLNVHKKYTQQKAIGRIYSNTVKSVGVATSSNNVGTYHGNLYNDVPKESPKNTSRFIELSQ